MYTFRNRILEILFCVVLSGYTKSCLKIDLMLIDINNGENEPLKLVKCWNLKCDKPKFQCIWSFQFYFIFNTINVICLVFHQLCKNSLSGTGKVWIECWLWQSQWKVKHTFTALFWALANWMLLYGYILWYQWPLYKKVNSSVLSAPNIELLCQHNNWSKALYKSFTEKFCCAHKSCACAKKL